jgi:hypothetical protein
MDLYLYEEARQNLQKDHLFHLYWRRAPQFWSRLKPAPLMRQWPAECESLSSSIKKGSEK